jgi:aryl-alcohol dehydrogenase-like predicted oxidoreductase
MATVMLGETPLARIGLGTNRLANTPENVAFVREAVAAGIGLIDTAHIYAGGESEQTIGAALSDLRDGCIVATKGGYGNGEGRPEVLRDQIEESLRRLRTDMIGLYYLHRPDPQTPLEESLGVIKEYADRGSIRYVGVSNVSVEQIEKAREVVDIAAVQNEYNLADRTHDDVVDYCESNGIVFVPYYPLGDGQVSAQEALAWLLRRSPVMLPIPGTLSIEHVKENVAAAELLP